MQLDDAVSHIRLLATVGVLLMVSVQHAHAAAIQTVAASAPAIKTAPQTHDEPEIDVAVAADTKPRANRSQRTSKEAKLPAVDDSNAINSPADDGDSDTVDLQAAASDRHHKMLDYFGLSNSGGGYYPPTLYPSPYQPHPYFTQSYYEAPPAAYPGNPYTGLGGGLDDDLMGRANRRKPGGGGGGSSSAASSQNSPIFYIRLPPTPYMYVPGMGYISQPPTIRPMSQQFPAMLAPPPSPPVNPFINVPVSFLANGKPTNVYEWPGTGGQSPQQQQQHQHHNSVGPVPPAMLGYPGGPQYPPYLPARPLQPSRPPGYRPGKPAGYLPDSKITHLKGPYVFNGRPEEIFVLPNSGPQPQQQSGYGMNPYAHHQPELQQQYEPSGYNPYHQHHHHQQPVYGDGYNSIYSNGLYGYY